ncbi:hypothetical protein GPECTOR_21g621 [Gonium pectorale]|uniref:Protein kinase domain-containing protein n=1 Tax=Gonium pectorale TaxID=33097 RepID=A0A150GIA5_GONPE|nr:hypothetical protein GPECTOR_21g621 [Gonium pectorale]|eukprot:KXZ49395.1 hypothetical protein GPECTOR_21g621 [Gonium pectorale]
MDVKLGTDGIKAAPAAIAAPGGGEDDAGVGEIRTGSGSSGDGIDDVNGSGGGKGDSDGDGGGSPDAVVLHKTLLGKGACTRVLMGHYRGERVAVKLLDTGLLEGCVGTALLFTDESAQSSSAVAAGDEGFGEGGGGGGVPGEGLKYPTNTALGMLEQEVQVLARCRHPNIVRLLAASLRPPRICLVMELMETSLDRFLYGESPAGRLLPLPTVLHIALQVARALMHLHPTIVHRDLKPANILLSSCHSPYPLVKLAVGTVPYMAPELFDVNNYTVEDRVDVFAFGVVLWEMLTGCRPWHGKSNMEVAVAVTIHNSRLQLSHLPEARCPRKLRALLTACWESQPARRPAAAELVKALALVQEALEHTASHGVPAGRKSTQEAVKGA